MLQSIHLENIAVIKSADVDFSNRFNVLTGETGSGKSLVVNSLGVLSGGRFSKEIIRTGQDNAYISGIFSDIPEALRTVMRENGFEDNEEIELLRSVSSDGKSLCKINGRTVTLSLYREIASSLVNIHGQQENWQLTDRRYQLDALDSFSGLENKVGEYRVCYAEYTDLLSKLNAMTEQIKEDKLNKDILIARKSELSKLPKNPSDEDRLISVRNELRKKEKISKEIAFSLKALKGGEKVNAVYLLERSLSTLENSENIQLQSLASRLSKSIEEVNDIASELRNIDDVPSESVSIGLNETESILEFIDRMKRKYNMEFAELLEYRETLNDKLERLDDSDSVIAEVKSRCDDLYKKCLKAADELHEIRKEKAADLSKLVTSGLSKLDMPGYTFKVSFSREYDSDVKGNLSQSGYDTVSFDVTASADEPFKSISKVSSGGELARIMLVVKSILHSRDESSMLVFDEVDSGVSGKTARKVGYMLRNLSLTSQVFCVTHSAQIASLADEHILSTKKLDNGLYKATFSLIENEDRVNELARILGGINITESQIKAAIDLLKDDLL